MKKNQTLMCAQNKFGRWYLLTTDNFTLLYRTEAKYYHSINHKIMKRHSESNLGSLADTIGGYPVDVLFNDGIKETGMDNRQLDIEAYCNNDDNLGFREFEPTAEELQSSSEQAMLESMGIYAKDISISNSVEKTHESLVATLRGEANNGLVRGGSADTLKTIKTGKRAPKDSFFDKKS
ncbi:hypothetical protein KKD70_05110 [Patescibacteria group bacterium]|nr:hypothetical protein [Patescibacteria group bacterium]